MRGSTLIALLCASVAFAPCAAAKDKDRKEQLTPQQQWLLWQKQHPQQTAPAPQRRKPVVVAPAVRRDPVVVPNAGGQDADTRDFMAVHNAARAAVGVPALRWSAACAAIAQSWADTLAARGGGLAHSGTPGYGENVFGGSGAWTPADAANAWLREKRDYRHQPIPLNDAGPVTGHYTQMVWRATREVGFGIARSRTGKIYVVGTYLPGGNMIGEKPY